MNLLKDHLISLKPLQLFWGLSIITLMSILTSIYIEKTVIMLIPLVLLVAFFISIYYEFFYWVLIGCIPISIVHDFNKSLSTDFPTEFLCIALTGMFWIDFLVRKREDILPILKHKITLILLGLFIWAIITSITAQLHTIAFKYTLAKTWYITSYFLLTFRMIKTTQDIKRLFWVLFLPLLFTTLYSFIRTALGHFNFELTSEFSLPFYENHVLYATTMSIFLPFIFLARKWYEEGTLIRLFLNLSILLFLLAIYFSYTRACYIALIVSLGVILVIKMRKIILSMTLVTILVASTLIYFSHNYYYLKLAPDFTKTVMHPEFKDHVIATFQGKDASSMERVNMWVSVFRMSVDHPWFGVGPNNFPFFYKPYSVLYFKTWVSDNPLNLSCHNYFWLMLAEQGWIGMILFLALIFLIYYYCQKNYTETKNQDYKLILIAISASFTIFLVNLIFSDLVENSKNGSLFFIILALLVRVEVWNQLNNKSHE